MEEAFEEGQGPHRTVEPVMMMMMTKVRKCNFDLLLSFQNILLLPHFQTIFDIFMFLVPCSDDDSHLLVSSVFISRPIYLLSRN
jgi:hypothetical protein